MGCTDQETGTEDLLVQLTRRVQGKYYGKYRGTVIDNLDPKKMGRVRLVVASLLGTTELDWALPCLPFGGLADQGWFSVPEIKAQVWVEFEEGELSQPIWTGTFWRKGDDVPKAAALEEPTTRLMKTPAGHIFQFDDKEGEEKILLQHVAGAEVTIDENGTVAVTDAVGSHVTLDADAEEVVVEDVNGNSLSMTASGITIEDSNGNKIEMASSGVTVEDSNGNKLEMTSSGVTITADKIELG
jgi:hypothetical protein